MKLTKLAIINYKLMIHDERLGEKHLILPEIAIEMIQFIARFKPFHSAISKMIVNCEFKRQILPNRSTKSHFQSLCGRKNESRTDWNQAIQGWRCLDRSMEQNHPRMHYTFEEHLNL